jgi:hypothetical protein
VVTGEKKMDRNENGRFTNSVYIFYELNPKNEEIGQISKQEKDNFSEAEVLQNYQQAGSLESPQRAYRDRKPATVNPPIYNINNNKKIKTSTNHIFEWQSEISESEKSGMLKFMVNLDPGDAQMLIKDFEHRLKQKSKPVFNKIGYFREFVNSFTSGGYTSPTQVSQDVELKKKESSEHDEIQYRKRREASELARDKLFAEHGLKH